MYSPVFPRTEKTFSQAAGRQAGVSLVEVLVALLVMSVGVLGYASLQLRALNSTGDSYLRTQAVAVARDAIERISANPSARDTYLTASAWPASAPSVAGNACYVNECQAAAMAQFDIQQLAWQAGSFLPNGRLMVEQCQASSATCVKVAWNDDVPADCEDASGAVSGLDCVVLEVVL